MLSYKVIAVPIETMEILQKRIQRDPNDYVALYRIALMYGRKDCFSLRMVDAFNALERTIERLMEERPDDPMVNYYYGKIIDRSWKREYCDKKIRDALNKALEAFLKMFYSDPNNTKYHKLIEDVCTSLGCHKRGVEIFLHLVQLNPGSLYALAKLAHEYYMNRQGEEAISILERIVQLYPEYADAYRFMGIIYYYDIGDFKKAEECIRKYLELNPKDDRIREFLRSVKNAVEIGIRGY